MWTFRLSGQQRPRGPRDFRTPFERDKTRVIHSAAFRRLQHKTQIYGGYGGNFHRTRLTHSLEVASIACSMIHYLKAVVKNEELLAVLPSDDLIEVICLLHDIGHPPFGHGGEAALNALMANYGGFESNAQTLHLVSSLETAYEPFGLDLCRRTLLGILKYPVAFSKAKQLNANRSLENLVQQANREQWVPLKSYYDFNQDLVDWILEPFTKAEIEIFQNYTSTQDLYCSLDCSIMDIADDIAYGVHDLEDAIHLGLIKKYHLEQPEVEDCFKAILELNYTKILDGLFSQHAAIRKQTIGEVVNYLVTSLEIEERPDFLHPLLRYRVILKPRAKLLLDALITCVFQHVIDSPPARAQEFGSQNLLIDLFGVIRENPHRLLDTFSRTCLLSVRKEGDLERIICDCLANLTDDMAIKLHGKLFVNKFSAQWENHVFI